MNYKKNAKAGLIALLFSFIFSILIIQTTFEESMLIGIGSGIATFIGVYFFKEYEKEKTISKKNSQVIDALFSVSSLPITTNPITSLEILSSTLSNPISKEFSEVKKRIDKGMGFEKSMQKVKQSNSSMQLKLMTDLFILWEKTGSNCQLAFRRLAEATNKIDNMQRDEKANLSVQRLTIAVSSALLVPMILGMLLSFSGEFSDIDFSGGESIGETPEKRQELQDAIKIANPIYIIEIGLISSYMLALQEKRPKKTILYSAFILPISISIFFYFSGGII